ncbi:MAG: type II 3-dehydroquinate dehydratase [Alphaproteobacteria bacterium]|nr:type II 3-dehydroquinate dehydratase [Alphaproteobacteria bacterium]MDX5368187.1 type II 3-dehydroquinate dehydratase [Alphaproteobacteria bacterium]MDX5463003.1 type II 3-dehydroquinate dehydratase [Alphaproteobacteria bacterium]
MTHRILVIHGPNLNMLGTREPGIYGSATLAAIDADLADAADGVGAAVTCRQSNAEGDIVGWIQQAAVEFDGIVLNAGAYTHTSVAIHDAIRACGKPVIEVHLSNTAARESFRHTSYVSPVALGVIMGLGPLGYRLALQALAAHLDRG